MIFEKDSHCFMDFKINCKPSAEPKPRLSRAPCQAVSFAWTWPRRRGFGKAKRSSSFDSIENGLRFGHFRTSSAMALNLHRFCRGAAFIGNNVDCHLPRQQPVSPPFRLIVSPRQRPGIPGKFARSGASRPNCPELPLRTNSLSQLAPPEVVRTPQK